MGEVGAGKRLSDHSWSRVVATPACPRMPWCEFDGTERCGGAAGMRLGAAKWNRDEVLSFPICTATGPEVQQFEKCSVRGNLVETTGGRPAGDGTAGGSEPRVASNGGEKTATTRAEESRFNCL